jgi:hypothetical protein
MGSNSHNRSNSQSTIRSNGRYQSDIDCNRERQQHVHELIGSVRIAEPMEEPHNHRFATITGEAIGNGMNHYHEVRFRTDYYDNHYHIYCGRTCNAVQVGDSHVHFIEAVTSQDDGHVHEFRAATLIDDPIDDDC